MKLIVVFAFALMVASVAADEGIDDAPDAPAASAPIPVVKKARKPKMRFSKVIKCCEYIYRKIYFT